MRTLFNKHQSEYLGYTCSWKTQ